jgi:hypothetical protein
VLEVTYDTVGQGPEACEAAWAPPWRTPWRSRRCTTLTVRLRAPDDVAAALFTVLRADQQQPCSVLTSLCRVPDEGKGDDKVGPWRHRRDADRGGGV